VAVQGSGVVTDADQEVGDSDARVVEGEVALTIAAQGVVVSAAEGDRAVSGRGVIVMAAPLQVQDRMNAARTSVVRVGEAALVTVQAVQADRMTVQEAPKVAEDSKLKDFRFSSFSTISLFSFISQQKTKLQI